MPDHSTLNQRISEASMYQAQERALLEGRFYHRSSQLNNFDRIIHRLTAAGRDTKKVYQRLDSECREALQSIREFSSPSVAKSPTVESIPTVHPVTLSGLYDLASPYLGPQGELFMGSQGYVRIPPASNGISVAPGTLGTSGEFETLELGQRGGILFSGLLEAEGPRDSEDLHAWLRNWKYVIPFPCTPSRAYLTYTFKIRTEFRVGGSSVADGTVMSFVSVGEQPKFGAGVEINVDQDAGWPVIADLTQPKGNDYNGLFGVLSGETVVQGTFSVPAGNTPAIGVIVGAIALISSGDCLFRFHGGSRILPSTTDELRGYAQYRYEPILVHTSNQ